MKVFIKSRRQASLALALIMVLSAFLVSAAIAVSEPARHTSVQADSENISTDASISLPHYILKAKKLYNPEELLCTLKRTVTGFLAIERIRNRGLSQNALLKKQGLFSYYILKLAAELKTLLSDQTLFFYLLTGLQTVFVVLFITRLIMFIHDKDGTKWVY